MRPITILITGFFFVSAFSSCMNKNEIYALDQRIEQVEERNLNFEKRLVQLNNQLYAEKGSQQKKQRQLRDQVAVLSAEMDRLRDEMQILRGKLEETDFKLGKKLTSAESVDEQRSGRFDNLEKSLKSIQDRLSRIERYLNLEVSAQPPAQPPAQPSQPAAPKAGTDIELYEAAKQALDRGDVESARQGFQDLITRFPKSQHADNAQFWIGDIFYREKWYEKAIVEYQKVIEKYPKGNKVQAALLKQGLAFYNIGDKSNARLILKELVKKYPQTNEALIARKKLKEF